MLNPFPELLTYALIAPFLLRVVLGIIYIRLGILTTRDRQTIFLRCVGAIHIAGGVMLLMGFYTQIAALVLSAVILYGFITSLLFGSEQTSTSMMPYYKALLFVATISLLFLGAGAFAFDLPL